MKTDGAKHSVLKDLPVFFPGRGETEVPNKVARWTPPFWVAHTFCSGVNKHWKNVHFAVRQGRKMPAPFFYSQAEKDAEKETKATVLKAGRARRAKQTRGYCRKQQIADEANALLKIAKEALVEAAKKDAGVEVATRRSNLELKNQRRKL